MAKNEDLDLLMDEEDVDPKQLKKILKASGINIPYLVRELKNVADSATDARTKLAAIQQMLSILGVDKKNTKTKSDEVSDEDKTWEDTLVHMIEQDRIKNQSAIPGSQAQGFKAYEVQQAVTPVEILKKKEDEKLRAAKAYSMKGVI